MPNSVEISLPLACHPALRLHPKSLESNTFSTVVHQHPHCCPDIEAHSHTSLFTCASSDLCVAAALVTALNLQPLPQHHILVIQSPLNPRVHPSRALQWRLRRSYHRHCIATCIDRPSAIRVCCESVGIGGTRVHVEKVLRPRAELESGAQRCGARRILLLPRASSHTAATAHLI